MFRGWSCIFFFWKDPKVLFSFRYLKHVTCCLGSSQTWIFMFLLWWVFVVCFHCTFFPQCVIPGYAGIQAELSWLLPCSFGWSSNFQVCWQTHCPSCWYCTLDEFFRVTRSLTRHFSALVTLGNALGGTQWDLLVCSYQSAVVMWIQLWWEITTWTGISPAFLSASHFWNFGYKNAVLY